MRQLRDGHNIFRWPVQGDSRHCRLQQVPWVVQQLHREQQREQRKQQQWVRRRQARIRCGMHWPAGAEGIRVVRLVQRPNGCWRVPQLCLQQDLEHILHQGVPEQQLHVVCHNTSVSVGCMHRCSAVDRHRDGIGRFRGTVKQLRRFVCKQNVRDADDWAEQRMPWSGKRGAKCRVQRVRRQRPGPVREDSVRHGAEQVHGDAVQHERLRRVRRELDAHQRTVHSSTGLWRGVCQVQWSVADMRLQQAGQYKRRWQRHEPAVRERRHLPHCTLQLLRAGMAAAVRDVWSVHEAEQWLAKVQL